MRGRVALGYDNVSALCSILLTEVLTLSLDEGGLLWKAIKGEAPLSRPS
jgi:hypothetical protein